MNAIHIRLSSVGADRHCPPTAAPLGTLVHQLVSRAARSNSLSWLAAQPRLAAVVQPAAWPRSKWPVDMPRSIHSLLHRRPVGSSPPSDSACPRRAPCNAVCLDCQQPWGSPRAGIASLRRAPRRSPCRRELTWCSPPPYIAYPRHVQRSAVCRRWQHSRDSPRAGIAFHRHAPCKTPCGQQPTWCSSPPCSACPRHAPCSG